MSNEIGSTIVNEKTGSSFLVIGKDEDVLIAMRTWVEPSPTRITGTRLGFRMRVIFNPDSVTPFGDFKVLAAKKYPGIKWTTLTKNYASLSGEVDINVPLINPELLKTCSVQCKVPDQIAEFCNMALGSPIVQPFVITGLLTQDIDGFIKNQVSQDDMSHPDSVILKFPALGGGKKTPLTDQDILG